MNLFEPTLPRFEEIEWPLQTAAVERDWVLLKIHD